MPDFEISIIFHKKNSILQKAYTCTLIFHSFFVPLYRYINNKYNQFLNYEY